MESKQTLSITISQSLYAKLHEEVGKGKISKFIEKLVEGELQDNNKKLAQEYQEAWKSKKRWQEFKEWEFTSLTDAKKKWK